MQIQLDAEQIELDFARYFRKASAKTKSSQCQYPTPRTWFMQIETVGSGARFA